MTYISRIKSIYNQGGFQKYLKNTSWLFLEKGFRIFIGLAVGIWLARYLGPDKYGAFQYAISFVSIFAAIATLGLDHIVIRELVSDESRRQKLLGTSFTLKLIGAIVSVFVLMITIQFADHESVVDNMILIVGASSILHCFNVIDFHFQSKVISKYVVYSNIFSLTLASLLKVVFIVMEAPVIAFAYLVTFESLITALGFVYYYLKTSNTPLFAWSFDKQVAKELLSESWPLIFGGMVLMLQARIDQIMLKKLAGNTEVGYYTVSLRLIEMLGFIPMLLQSSLLPSLINSKKASGSLYKSRLLNYYRLNFIFFLLTAIPIFFFSDWIILTLYKEEYAAAAPLLAIMTSRIVLANMGVARSSFINIESLFKFSMLTMIIGTVINVVLNYYLIPEYLSTGAIVSTIISFTVTTFVVDFFYSKTRPNAWLLVKSMLTFYALKIDFLKEKK